MGGSVSYTPSSSSRPAAPRPKPRLMPIRIICLGLPRTGTASLCQALSKLGNKHPYHFRTLLQHRGRDAAKLRRLLRSKMTGASPNFGISKYDFDELYFNNDAVSDIPTIIFYEELLRCYPDAKVILTVRDSAEEWAESYRETVQRTFKEIYQPKTLATRLRQSIHKSDLELLCKDIQKYYLDELESNPEKFYNEWNNKIKARVRSGNLLVYNVNEGWDPLIRFVGPRSFEASWLGPFPHVNRRETFPQMFFDDSASTLTANSTASTKTAGSLSSIASDSTLVGSTATRRTLRRTLRE